MFYSYSDTYYCAHFFKKQRGNAPCDGFVPSLLHLTPTGGVGEAICQSVKHLGSSWVKCGVEIIRRLSLTIGRRRLSFLLERLQGLKDVSLNHHTDLTWQRLALLEIEPTAWVPELQASPAPSSRDTVWGKEMKFLCQTKRLWQLVVITQNMASGGIRCEKCHRRRKRYI